MKKIIFAVLMLLLSFQSFAETKRSPTQRAHFVKSHPCPATGKNYGACPGYVVDHIVALCDGGKDDPSNMQWQTAAAGKAKDKTECKAKRK